MASFVIEGGHRLSGDIYPQGAKKRGVANYLRHIAHCRRGDCAQYPGHTGRQQPYPIDAGYGSQRI